MCLHLVALITIYILPRFLHGEKRATAASTEKKSTSTTASAECAVTNGNIPVPEEHRATILTASPDTTAACNGDDNNKNCDRSTVHSNGIDQQPKNNGHIANSNQKNHDENLSHLIRKRIDSETRNLEKLVENSLDKTVIGIVEFKDDLMRMSDDERFATAAGDGGLRMRRPSDRTVTNDTSVDAFLKREIHAAVNQVNVLPAVLSNGHGAD